ncbi:MAG: hypothetical protein JWQ85_156 [Mucilaginibacter sp.]|nr:hypothetical protein [Mucilaginibacter sp.]
MSHVYYYGRSSTNFLLHFPFVYYCCQEIIRNFYLKF